MSTRTSGEVGVRRERPRRAQHVLVVQSTTVLSPHMVRVQLGGPAFHAFMDQADPDRLGATDKYVKLQIAPQELGLTPPYDLEALRLVHPVEALPVQRTYTIRHVDAVAQTIAIDFVVHGDDGVAGPWARRARAGDLLALSGPGGGYRPSMDPEVQAVLLGDASALPAIAAALEAMPAATEGTAIIEIQDAADELELLRPPGVRVEWVRRGASPAGVALVAATERLRVPTGPVEVFAHGERAAMKSVRAVLQDRWGLDRRSMSLSAYWALGRAEDRFQAEKREPVGALFAD